MAEQNDPEKVENLDEDEPPKEVPALPPKPLNVYQKAAAAFLAQNGYTHGARTKGCLITRAATLIGYSRVTIHAWLKIPAFRQEIEMHQARYDAAASDGWMTLLRGLPEHGVAPNVAAIIAWKKSRSPEVFDEQFRREEAKRKHELEVLKLKQQHEKEMIELKAKLGVSTDDEHVRVPAFIYRETGPGERLYQAARSEDTEH